MSILKKLNEWQEAGLLNPAQAETIRLYEENQPSATKFLWHYGLLGLGLLIIMIGIVAIAASNWDAIPASLKLGLHIILNIAVAGGLFMAWQKNEQKLWRFEGLLLVKATLVLTLMALLGQILQTQSPLNETMLLWWALITPMLLWLGRYRPSFTLWTALTIYVFCTNIPANDFVVYAIAIAFIQLYMVLPIFSFWTNHKGSWVPNAQRVGSLLMLAGVTYLCFDRPAAHFWSYRNTIADVHNWEYYSLELALLANMALVTVLGFLRYRTLSFITMIEQSGIWLRLVIVHLIVALLLCSVPQWFGWFIIYWLMVGFVGLRLDDRRIVSTAISLIAIRMIIYYFMLTQSLMVTGILMIISGAAVIYLVKTYAQWRVALLTMVGSRS